MFKRFLFLVGCSLALISCSTKPVQLSENEIVQYRAPAATIDQMDQSFQMIMQNVSSSAKMKTDYLTRLLRINYRIDGEVVNYEAELDNAIQRRRADPSYSFSPQTSPTYYKLMQLRFLSDEQVATIVHIYNRLYETVTDAELPQARRIRAQTVIGEFNKTLRSMNDPDKLQAVELFNSLREAISRYKGAALLKSNDRMPASAKVEWQDVERSFEKFDKDDLSSVRRKYAKEISKRAAAAVASNEIELEPMLEPVPQSDRAPSSEKYAPGTGTYGNVIGLSFPTGLFSITYDDGPNNSSTLQLLDLLSSTGTPASMFWLTQNIARFPASVEKAKALKIPINSHSWSHANLVKLGSAGLDKEVNQAVSVAKDKIGVQPFSGRKDFRFFRCPYGACFSPASPVIRSRIANLNLIHAFWTVDSLDWKYVKDPDRTFALVTKGMQASGRGVILFHDIHQSSVGVTKRLIPWIKAQKYRLATLESAVDQYNSGVKP
jgi:peptidoglycan/xylan/chitin deacetylase (PgdA/CDA1 family)